MNNATPRFDIYRLVHKGLRACMTDVLGAAGRMDPLDDTERTAVLAEVREMLAFCYGHLKKEEAFVHPAIEARAPGASQKTAGDHVDHLHWFDELETAVGAVEQAQGGARAVAAAALYRSLGFFVGENFTHMHVEETANNEVLWRTHSDSELVGLEEAIVASLSPQEKIYAMRWILPVLTPAERAQMLGAMQSNLPREAFASILAMLRPRVTDSNWRKLTAQFAAPGLAA
jgi:hypothetical protein